MTGKSWAEAVADEVRRFPVIVLLLLLSSIVAAIGTIYAAADCALGAYDAGFRWREREYDKIDHLRAGISIDRYEELLGSPLFRRKNDDDSLTESSFKGRDYWVQAVHDDEGTVLLFSVTSCDDHFTPTFDMPSIGRVTLNRVRLADVATPSSVMYGWATASGNQNFYDAYYAGNPGNYKTYFVAINDACPIQAIDVQPLADRLLFMRRTPLSYGSLLLNETPVPPEDRAAIDVFRLRSIPNTYGEAFFFSSSRASRQTVDAILADFQVGVDRILIRTVR